MTAQHSPNNLENILKPSNPKQQIFKSAFSKHYMNGKKKVPGSKTIFVRRGHSVIEMASGKLPSVQQQTTAVTGT